MFRFHAVEVEILDAYLFERKKAPDMALWNKRAGQEWKRVRATMFVHAVLATLFGVSNVFGNNA